MTSWKSTVRNPTGGAEFLGSGTDRLGPAGAALQRQLALAVIGNTLSKGIPEGRLIRSGVWADFYSNKEASNHTSVSGPGIRGKSGPLGTPLVKCLRHLARFERRR